MTTAKENQQLTRVGKGTPMGDFMRLFWIPAVPSSDLLKDGEPVRLRLLGEDMIAFRDTKGRVGLLAPYCAHRRAELYFGRNEDCGLRCVYHGWKFDVEGTIVETPNTTANITASQRTYRSQERNGVVWAFLGDTEPPPLPDLEFNLLPRENVFWTLRVQDTNWLQGVEGNIDSTHAPLLHKRIDRPMRAPLFSYDNEAHFEATEADWGVAVGARRNVESGGYHWRVNNFIFPFYAMIPPITGDPQLQLAVFVPMDDETTISWLISYHPVEALSRGILDVYHNRRSDGTETGHLSKEATIPVDQLDGTLPFIKYWPRYNRANNYGQNFDRQRYKYYSGIPGIWAQDGGIQGTMGAITDRTAETLCSSDLGIVKTRRLLLRVTSDFVDKGVVPACAKDPSVFRVRGVGVRSDSASFADAVEQYVYREGDYGYEVD